MWWFVGIVVVVVVLYLLDREIYFYEGTHLGPRVQGWLYDRWAKKYDQGKKESQAHDAEMLAKPVLTALEGTSSPLILDLATGTGRLPLVLFREPAFQGAVVAVDVSTGMLDQAAQRLSEYRERLTLVRVIDFPLPFPDQVFDGVCCMEALEVMPEMETPLAELFRVLRPGGLLLSSRGTTASGRSAKIRSVDEFTSLVQKTGFEQVEIIPWWRWFDRVTARKPGRFVASEARSVTNVLKCPKCGEVRLNSEWVCGSCGAKVPTSANGILLL